MRRSATCRIGCRWPIAIALLATAVLSGLTIFTPAIHAAQAPDPFPKVYGLLRHIVPVEGAPAAPAGMLAAVFPVLQGSFIGVSIHTGSANDTLAALFALGRLAGNVRGDTIEAYLPVPDILALAGRDEIRRIEAIVPPQPAVTSQGRSVHNAAAWNAAGVTGAGVKVGIIDVGFSGIQRLMGTELPAAIAARCYSALGIFTPILATCDGGTNHGTAVAETLLDIAPGVQLYVSQPISKLDFANAVDWMLSQGVTVINYSATWTWDGPGDGSSPFSDSPLQTVEAAVAGGATFVAAAGNTGSATWSGAWRDENHNEVHEFAAAKELNGLSLASGQRLDVQLRWADSWTAAQTDLDVYLVDAGGAVWAQSTSRQQGRPGNTPAEYFSMLAPAAGTYAIKVVHVSGPAPAWLQVQSFNALALQYATGGGIGNPAESATPGVLAVGAASWQTPGAIEPYSSTGPTPDGRIKPDIVGADQGDTVTYGPFGGTSQAAPHVAGLAALVKAAFPAFTPAQVAGYLTANALPRGPAPNTTWGWGFARLPAACAATVAPTSASLPQDGGTLTLSIATAATCAWTASSQAPWLALGGKTAGTGSATIVVTAAANAGIPRTGTLVVGTASVVVTQAGPLAPSATPQRLTALVSGNYVTLSWQTPTAGVPSGYRVEIGTGPGLADLAAISVGTTTTYAFEATPGLYYARVRALAGAAAGSPSNEVSFRIGPPPAAPLGVPSAPRGLAATVTGANVQLTWDPPAAAAGLLGYLVEAGSAPGLANLASLVVTTPQLYVPGVPPGTYYVRVKAGNAQGIGPASNEVIVPVAGPQPGPVRGLRGAVAGSTVTLQWQPPATGAAPTSYLIVAGDAPGRLNVASIPVGLSTTVSGAVPRGVYYVRVVALNRYGSAASDEILVTVP